MLAAMIRTCPSCGQRNRIPAARLTDTGRCGKCQSALAPPAEPLDIDDVSTFDEVVRGATVPVVVDFWAEWCGPCKMMAPELEKAAGDLASKAIVLKVNTEKVPALAQRYQVRSIPDVAVFRGGTIVKRRAGAVGRRELTDWVRSA
jgi:thioredoxin 2